MMSLAPRVSPALLAGSVTIPFSTFQKVPAVSGFL